MNEDHNTVISQRNERNKGTCWPQLGSTLICNLQINSWLYSDRLHSHLFLILTILPVLNLEHYKHKKGYFRTKSHHTVPEYIILLVMGKLLEFISVKRQAGKQRNDAFNSAKYTVVRDSAENLFFFSA